MKLETLEKLGVLIQDKNFKYIKEYKINWLNPLTYLFLLINFLIGTFKKC